MREPMRFSVVLIEASFTTAAGEIDFIREPLSNP